MRLKTRLLFVSDIHGSDRLFYKLTNAGGIYKANVIVIGGDVAGKAITPILSRGAEFEASIQGTRRIARNREELAELEKEVRSLGSYPYVTEEGEWNELTRNERAMEQLFDRLISESLRTWCSLAEQRLKPLSIRLIVNKGNDDPEVVEQTIISSGFVEYPNERVVELDRNHEMISLGYSNITPWNLPGDLPEDALAQKIETLVSSVRSIENCVFNIHVPPVNTHLDIAPLLDKELKPRMAPGGEPEMAHVGSVAVREAIEKHQPLLGLHGHIHESRGYSRIGRTHCFNPGSEYSIGVLKGVLLDISEDGLASHAFTSG